MLVASAVSAMLTWVRVRVAATPFVPNNAPDGWVPQPHGWVGTVAPQVGGHVSGVAFPKMAVLDVLLVVVVPVVVRADVVAVGVAGCLLAVDGGVVVRSPRLVDDELLAADVLRGGRDRLGGFWSALCVPNGRARSACWRSRAR